MTMHRGERRRSGEAGEMTLAMMLMALAVLAIGVAFLVFGQATDARGKAQKAADSGALAAADDVRDWWAHSWLTTMQTPPPPLGTPVPANDHTVSLGPATSRGSAESIGSARDFAWQNDESSVEEEEWGVYPAPTNPENAIHVSVGTDSHELSAVHDSGSTLQGEARAVAEISAKSGVSCLKKADDAAYANGERKWTMTCGNADGDHASADYLERDPVNLSTDKDDFAEFFEIQLVD